MIALLLCAVLTGNEPIPSSVLRFKDKCEDERSAFIERAKKEVAADRLRVQNARNEADLSRFSKDVKLGLARVKSAKTAAWYSYPPQIDIKIDGSIGVFGEQMPDGARIQVRFRADRIEGDKVIGAIIHDGATPKMKALRGGAVIRDPNSTAGRGSESRAVILGQEKNWKARETRGIEGLFEVVSPDPLTLKPFDPVKWDLLMAETKSPQEAAQTKEVDPAAAAQLKLAKSLLRTNDGAAKKRLQEIIDKYPDTDAAAEAAKLLGK